MDNHAAKPLRVALISMPWSIFNRPSIQLGVLKSFLEKDETIRVDTFHPYLTVAKTIGIDAYKHISLNSWAGEALYSPLLFPEHSEQAEQLFKKSCPDTKDLTFNFQEVSHTLGHSLTTWLTSLDLEKYDLIGFSICFSQLLSSLAAAAAIKRITQNTPIVFGGSSCGGELGPSLLQTFPQIDYVIDGEGENPLLSLCHFLTGQTDCFPTQVKSRRTEKSGYTCDPIKDLNTLPIPDYSSYFQELQTLFPGQPFLPVLPLEFSRGCWWNKCTFCNLNIQWKGYRWKSARRTFQETTHLSQTHKCLDFTFTDNALPPTESDHLFQMLAKGGSDFRFFAEIRVITDPGKISLYRHGGLTRVQVGIESLSGTLLKRLQKGTTVIENIAAMKYCAENNITLEGKLITEFPGSKESEVQETLANLDYVLPYHPLSSASFFLGLGSPVEQHPEQFGLTAVTHHTKNRKLFPKELLTDLELLIKDYRGDRQKQRKLWKQVTIKIKGWQKFHKNRKEQPPPALSYRDGGNFLIIHQEQITGETLIHRLSGRSRELYLFCSEIRTIEEILRTFSTLPQKSILIFFDDLCKKRLLFREKKSYLALAVHASHNSSSLIHT